LIEAILPHNDNVGTLFMHKLEEINIQNIKVSSLELVIANTMRSLSIIGLLCLGCLAHNAYARSLLQGKPDLCDKNSGSWDPYDINCDFDCGANGWEVRWAE
jgi:hypothetical protein